MWKVGNTIVATNTAAQGNNSFDITEYLNVGANTIRLTITDSFGTLATKTWTVTIVEFKLESTFDDTLLYTNTDVVFRYTPYGNVNKTLHFILDETINNRLRGVSRMDSLEIILERSTRKYTTEEKENPAELCLIIFLNRNMAAIYSKYI